MTTPPPELVPPPRRSRLRGIAGGFLAALAHGLASHALSPGDMAHISALRKEAPGGAGRRIAAAGLVAAGVIALQLG